MTGAAAEHRPVRAGINHGYGIDSMQVSIALLPLSAPQTTHAFRPRPEIAVHTLSAIGPLAIIDGHIRGPSHPANAIAAFAGCSNRDSHIALARNVAANASQ
jgi:hypothetical protein